jgi:hypothetical protein
MIESKLYKPLLWCESCRRETRHSFVCDVEAEFLNYRVEEKGMGTKAMQIAHNYACTVCRRVRRYGSDCEKKAFY